MKILIVTQRFWPESFRITDIAETLVKEGHKVTVLTGLPNYPQGYLYDGYKHGENRVQEHNGVKIYRAKEIERRNDIIHRFLNYYSFPHYAKKLIKKMDDDFDVVLVNELSPIMAAIPAFWYKKKHNIKVVMYEMDLWPESLLAGGIKKDSFLYNHYKKVSAKIYSQCDKILVSTKEHIDYIKALSGCDKLDIDYLPQYAEEQFDKIKSKPIKEGDTINLMFAGNIGKAQSVDTIIRAAALLKNDTRFKFHIVGSGSEYDNNMALAKQLNATNVIFYGQKPVEDMPRLYEMAQAMLVTLEDSHFANLTIPGKVQSYIASGKPVIGAVNGSCANFIKNKGIGLTCNSGDYKELAKIINNISKKEIEVFSNKAFNIYKNEYNKNRFIKMVIESLK